MYMYKKMRTLNIILIPEPGFSIFFMLCDIEQTFSMRSRHSALSTHSMSAQSIPSLQYGVRGTGEQQINILCIQQNVHAMAIHCSSQLIGMIRASLVFISHANIQVQVKIVLRYLKYVCLNRSYTGPHKSIHSLIIHANFDLTCCTRAARGKRCAY
jgi:hypothetical protein